MNFVFVGLGGALGAVLRYAISILPYKGDFPVLTLATNLTGALLIGMIAGSAAKRGFSDHTVLFLKTGVCGGFTTFSTFSLETYSLLQSRQTALAVVYMGLSLFLCLAGVFLGMWIAER